MTHHYFRNDGTLLQAAELRARVYARESVPGSSLGTLGRQHAQALVALLDEARRERDEAQAERDEAQAERDEARQRLGALREAARETLIAFEGSGAGDALGSACRGLLGALVASNAALERIAAALEGRIAVTTAADDYLTIDKKDWEVP